MVLGELMIFKYHRGLGWGGVGGIGGFGRSIGGHPCYLASEEGLPGARVPAASRGVWMRRRRRERGSGKEFCACCWKVEGEGGWRPRGAERNEGLVLKEVF